MIGSGDKGAKEFCDEEALTMQEWDAAWVRMQNVNSRYFFPFCRFARPTSATACLACEACHSAARKWCSASLRS